MDRMVDPDRSKRRHLNVDQKRAMKAATVSLFVQQYSRKAQRGVEPKTADMIGTLRRRLSN
jgi:hypothetical protein